MPTTSLASRQAIALRGTGSVFRSALITLQPQADRITLQLRLPTRERPLAWGSDTSLRVSLHVDVDGQRRSIVGGVTGGIKPVRSRDPQGLYQLQFGLGHRETGAATYKRLGEDAQTFTGFVEIELIKGTTCDTELIVAQATESPAPARPTFHNSVTFDAATDGSENNGDSVLSITHTNVGTTDLVAFASNSQTANGATSTSITYGGVSMGTALWNLAQGGTIGCAAYALAAPATGSQTCTSTVSGTHLGDHHLAVTTFLGGDQTTPAGTPLTVTATQANTTLTPVAGAASGNMVVSAIATDYGDGSAQTSGADETLRSTESSAWTGLHTTVSTQDGAVSPATISWSHSSRFVCGGAVVINEETGGGGASALPPRGLNINQSAHRASYY